MDWFTTILVLVVGLVLGSVAVSYYYRLGFSKVKQQIEQEKSESELKISHLLADAQKQGERRKKDLIQQAAEEISRSKKKLEAEVQSHREALTKERQKLEKKFQAAQQEEDRNRSERERLQAYEQQLQDRKGELDHLEQEKVRALEQISSMSMEQARDRIMESAEVAYRRDQAQLLRQIEEETKAKADHLSREIVVNAIQRYASDYVAELTVSAVQLPSDEHKGRIIGREGRNIRTFETISGVDVIIDDTPEAVVLSCFDPVRREIAKIALQRLIEDGRIHPARIEEMLQKAEKEMDEVMVREGERAALETGILGLAPEIIQLLGRMKYRTSYGQNALQHSVEVCWLAGIMAAELGLDVNLAKRAGLLHDIGKSVTYIMEGSHVDLGVEIAKRNNEHPVVINAIASHHGDHEATDPISVLVAAADALSASRPGARRENLETYIKRVQALEEIAESFPGVEKCFAVQGGREIRVIVLPEEVSDEEMVLRAREIKERIENELTYPGQIKINIIRESRAIDYAK